jgi:hypothetical protein
MKNEKKTKQKKTHKKFKAKDFLQIDNTNIYFYSTLTLLDWYSINTGVCPPGDLPTPSVRPFTTLTVT